MAIIYLPFLQAVFKTEALGPVDLAIILVFSSLPFWGMEVVKALNRKLRLYSIV
jgi:Ca2+-transporting ATPase